MLYSYLLDPTYSSHRLSEVALRRFNLKLAGELAESADITGRLASALRRSRSGGTDSSLYEEIDLPLVPVLARMEQAGVKIDTGALAKMSTKLEREIASKAKRDLRSCRHGIQRRLSEATRRRSLQPHEPAKTRQIRQGTNDLDCRRCSRRACGKSCRSRAWSSTTGS